MALLRDDWALKGGLVMPWKETAVVNLRSEFVLKVLGGKVPFEALSETKLAAVAHLHGSGALLE